ncbi:hypothetical protein pp2_253 [Vibrio phage phi-pp2]|uniref:7-cyano-7-deazaguanine synthase n=1 Tax=Vibrio phage phi-pp2 TaxID=1204514 RepID=I6XCE0_9CAUD|nr:hypothetical protein pp2_253 [Vibrio phage phi-pp2]
MGYDEIILVSGLDSLVLYEFLERKPHPVYFKWGFAIDELEMAALPEETTIIEMPEILHLKHDPYEFKTPRNPDLIGRNTLMFNSVFHAFRPNVIYRGMLKGDDFYYDASPTHSDEIAAMWSKMLDKECRIEQPFKDKTKRDIMQMAVEYGIDANSLQHCYNREHNCGRCSKCVDAHVNSMYTDNPDIMWLKRIVNDSGMAALANHMFGVDTVDRIKEFLDEFDRTDR